MVFFGYSSAMHNQPDTYLFKPRLVTVQPAPPSQGLDVNALHRPHQKPRCQPINSRSQAREAVNNFLQLQNCESDHLRTEMLCSISPNPPLEGTPEHTLLLLQSDLDALWAYIDQYRGSGGFSPHLLMLPRQVSMLTIGTQPGQVSARDVYQFLISKDPMMHRPGRLIIQAGNDCSTLIRHNHGDSLSHHTRWTTLTRGPSTRMSTCAVHRQLQKLAAKHPRICLLLDKQAVDSFTEWQHKQRLQLNSTLFNIRA